MTRRRIHTFRGECLGHFPTAGWLRVACAYVQRHMARERIGWDDPVSDETKKLIGDIQSKMKENDPTRGAWNVDPKAPITVWTDASSISYGVVLETEGNVIEDGSWLRSTDDSTHINRCELDAAIKGLNFALKNESARDVVGEFECIFSEFGPPRCVMSDNGTVFRSREFQTFLMSWEVKQILSCSYRSQGNAVIERAHRTIKRTVKRSEKSVAEAVFWINNTKGSAEASPYEMIFCASSRKPGIVACRTEITGRPKLNCKSTDSSAYEDVDRNPFSVGDRVFLKTPEGRCDDVWGGPHTVTNVLSSVSVEIGGDGVSRHVSHLRHVPRHDDGSVDSLDEGSSVVLDIDEAGASGELNADAPVEDGCSRGSRVRCKPVWHRDYVFS